MDTANQSWSGYDVAKAGAGTVDAYAAVYGNSTGSANQGITPSYMLATDDDAIAFDSVGWNTGRQEHSRLEHGWREYIHLG